MCMNRTSVLETTSIRKISDNGQDDEARPRLRPYNHPETPKSFNGSCFHRTPLAPISTRGHFRPASRRPREHVVHHAEILTPPMLRWHRDADLDLDSPCGNLSPDTRCCREAPAPPFSREYMLLL